MDAVVIFHLQEKILSSSLANRRIWCWTDTVTTSFLRHKVSLWTKSFCSSGDGGSSSWHRRGLSAQTFLEGLTRQTRGGCLRRECLRPEVQIRWRAAGRCSSALRCSPASDTACISASQTDMHMRVLPAELLLFFCLSCRFLYSGGNNWNPCYQNDAVIWSTDVQEIPCWVDLQDLLPLFAWSWIPILFFPLFTIFQDGGGVITATMLF